MTFYHGSPIGGLSELQPFLSEHGKAYIYFATNPLVALFYYRRTTISRERLYGHKKTHCFRMVADRKN